MLFEGRGPFGYVSVYALVYTDDALPTLQTWRLHPQDAEDFQQLKRELLANKAAYYRQHRPCYVRNTMPITYAQAQQMLEKMRQQLQR